jgi:hypothetical protein
MQGLTTTISTAINKLIGAVAANMSEKRGYAIAVGQLGGVCKFFRPYEMRAEGELTEASLDRVDYLLYYYKFTSKAITSVCEEMLLQCWVISSVNVDQLNTNTLNVILQQGYSPEKGETEVRFLQRLEKMKSQVIAELDNDKVRAAVLKHKTEEAIRGINSGTEPDVLPRRPVEIL